MFEKIASCTYQLSKHHSNIKNVIRYLKAIRNISRAAARYGIYTLLDFHQDVLGDRWCGEGVPGWLGDELAKVVNTAPWWNNPFGVIFGNKGKDYPWNLYHKMTLTDNWATPDPVKYNGLPDRQGCRSSKNVCVISAKFW